MMKALNRFSPLLLLFLASCAEDETASEAKPGSADVASLNYETEFQEDLAANLVEVRSGEWVSAPESLVGKDWIAVYYSAHWCPPCRQFTPGLSEFYDQASKDYPNFQLVFMSSDKSSNAMKEYMEWGDMNFPAVQYENREGSGLEKFAARGIPYLVVLDKDGNQVLGKSPDESWQNPAITLANLQKMLRDQSL